MDIPEKDVARYLLETPAELPDIARFLYRINYRHGKVDVSSEGSETTFTYKGDGKKEDKTVGTEVLTPDKLESPTKLAKGTLYKIELPDGSELRFQIGGSLFSVTSRKYVVHNATVNQEISKTERWHLGIEDRPLSENSVYPLGRESTGAAIQADVWSDPGLKTIYEKVKGDNFVSRHHGIMVPTIGDGVTPAIYMIDFSTYGTKAVVSASQTSATAIGAAT